MRTSKPGMLHKITRLSRSSNVLAPEYLDFIPVTTVHPWLNDPLPEGWTMVKDEMTTRYYFKKYARICQHSLESDGGAMNKVCGR